MNHSMAEGPGRALTAAIALTMVAVAIVAFAVPMGADDYVGDLSDAQVTRLRGQARVQADAVPGWPVVREAAAPSDEPYAATGVVDFLGPFGIRLATVEVGPASQNHHSSLLTWIGAWSLPVVIEVVLGAWLVRRLVAI